MLSHLSKLTGLTGVLVAGAFALAGLFLSGIPLVRKAAWVMFAVAAGITAWNEFRR